MTYSIGQATDPSTVCNMLRQIGQRKTIANALTQVAALPCSSEGLSLRNQIAAIGGLESIEAILLSSDDDVRLQCKAASALGSLCNSAEVARGFISGSSAAAVMEKLGCMLRSNNMWAQADAVGCLGWLVGNGMPFHTLRKLIPVVTRLLGKQNDCSPGLSECNRDEAGTQNAGGGRGGPGGRRRVKEAERRQEVALERMDNLRVYSLIFLLKATNADPSTMPMMLANEAVDYLLEILSMVQLIHATRENPDPSHAIPYGERVDAEPTIDDQNPSLVLAAKLLGAFSLEPVCGAFLLEAKCVPKLLCFRKHLRQHCKFASKTSTTGQPSSAAAFCGHHQHRHYQHHDHACCSPGRHGAPPQSTNVSATSTESPATSTRRTNVCTTCTATCVHRKDDRTNPVTERGNAPLAGKGRERGVDCGREASVYNEELQQPGLDDLITFVVEQVLSWGMRKQA